MTIQTIGYIAAQGVRKADHESFLNALRIVLDNMPTSVSGDAETGLTAEEQRVLREGGLTLKPTPGPDPMMAMACQYAEIIVYSLSIEEASKNLDTNPEGIQHMIENRSLYSFLVNDNRYIPDFQFDTEGRQPIPNLLIPGIAHVNKALNPQMHPVEVYDWYHRPNSDLFLNDDIDDTVSPLDWLKTEQNLDLLLLLASRL